MIQLFGIHAQLNLIQMEHNLGELRELVFACDKETANKIISEAVKRGIPFERTLTGVNIYN